MIRGTVDLITDLRAAGAGAELQEKEATCVRVSSSSHVYRRFCCEVRTRTGPLAREIGKRGKPGWYFAI